MACATCGKKRPAVVRNTNGTPPVISRRRNPVIRGVVQKPTPPNEFNIKISDEK